MTIPALAAAIPPPGETIDSACDPDGEFAWGLPWTLAGANMRQACGSLYGDYGYQAIKPCRPPTQVGLLGSVLLVIHETVRDRPGCEPALRDMLP